MWPVEEFGVDDKRGVRPDFPQKEHFAPTRVADDEIGYVVVLRAENGRRMGCNLAAIECRDDAGSEAHLGCARFPRRVGVAGCGIAEIALVAGVRQDGHVMAACLERWSQMDELSGKILVDKKNAHGPLRLRSRQPFPGKDARKDFVK